MPEKDFYKLFYWNSCNNKILPKRLKDGMISTIRIVTFLFFFNLTVGPKFSVREFKILTPRYLARRSLYLVAS